MGHRNACPPLYKDYPPPAGESPAIRSRARRPTAERPGFILRIDRRPVDSNGLRQLPRVSESLWNSSDTDAKDGSRAVVFIELRSEVSSDGMLWKMNANYVERKLLTSVNVRAVSQHRLKTNKENRNRMKSAQGVGCVMIAVFNDKLISELASLNGAICYEMVCV